MRKRKVTYPPAKTSNRPAPATGLPTDPPYVRPTVATIDLTAGKGRAGLAVGGKVRIAGNGLYAGEIAVIEKLGTGGVIPSAIVRTEAGKTRQVRTIDLEPVGATPGAESRPHQGDTSASIRRPPASGWRRHEYRRGRCYAQATCPVDPLGIIRCALSPIAISGPEWTRFAITYALRRPAPHVRSLGAILGLPARLIGAALRSRAAPRRSAPPRRAPAARAPPSSPPPGIGMTVRARGRPRSPRPTHRRSAPRSTRSRPRTHPSPRCSPAGGPRAGARGRLRRRSSVRSVKRSIGRSRIALDRGRRPERQQHLAGRHGVQRDPRPGPVAHEDRLHRVHLVDVVDEVAVGHRQTGRLARRLRQVDQASGARWPPASGSG